MNKQELMKMVSGARGGEPVCKPVRLRSVGQLSKGDLAYCPLPEDDSEALLRELRAAPKFAKIDAKEVLRRAQHGVRAVLISESAYDASQAALYLAALSRQLDRDTDEEDEDDPGCDWTDEELDAMLGIESTEREIKNALMVASASLLDPETSSSSEEDSPIVTMMAGGKKLDTSSLSAPALLVYADSGAVLSPAVVEQLENVCAKDRDTFVALKKSQIDLELVNELLFKHHFMLLNVLPATDEYLANVLRAAAHEQHLTLAPDVDCSAAVSQMRRLRGKRFHELDLYDLVSYAAQRAQGGTITSADLTYQPYSPKPGGKSAMDELCAMTGLDNVKTVLRRQIAVSALMARLGKDSAACRSLAFAGSPGTGKSVTARLVAEIMREEGCGTGRFVEAGREQIIGKYLGHTSPKIAKLFEAARGGVLFIDEAGALIPGRDDNYAEEAVNALVRHMELEPETMVIFATYSDEMKKLLDSNPGLSSRIARVLEFADYTDEQLWGILGTLTEKEDFALPADAHDACCAFFRTLRERRGRNFGNGREARRLRDAAIEELALRVKDCDEPVELTAADFEAAAKRLLEQEEAPEPRRRVGF